MAQVKRITVTIPDNLLAEADDIAEAEKMGRNEFIQEAMKLYIAERRSYLLREQLKEGYLAMANINLSLAIEQCHIEDEVEPGFFTEDG